MSVEGKEAATALLKGFDLPGVATPPAVSAPPPTGLPSAVPQTPPPSRGWEWPRVQRAGRLLIVALTLGGMFDALCGNSAWGIGFPIFVLALLGATLTLGAEEGIFPRWQNALTLGVPILFFAGAVAVRANGFLTFWNVAATFVLYLLFLHYSVNGRLEEINFARFCGFPWRVYGASLVFAAPAIHVAVHDNEKRRETQARLAPLMRGLLIMLPILAVFVALFSSADNIFARLLHQIGEWLLPKDIMTRLFHLALALGAAWKIAGGFVYSRTRREENTTTNASAATRRPPLGFTEAMTVLGGVCSVFIAFIAIQFLYLFGDKGHIAQAFGMNYADYARHGFFELVVVAALALTLIYNLQAQTRRESDGQRRALNLIGTLLVGMTLILLLSAARRMQLYETAWGATQLRLYVDHFLVWLGIALCWFVMTLWRVPRRFPIGALACGVGFLVGLNLANLDDAIVRRNIERYAITKNLDIDNLLALSDDAVPALCDAFDSLPTGPLKARLGKCLRYRKNTTGLRHPDWSQMHWSRYQAQQASLNRQAFR